MPDSTKPSRFSATPAEIDAFLREHFAEDVLQKYQWAIGEAAVRTAVSEARTACQYEGGEGSSFADGVDAARCGHGKDQHLGENSGWEPQCKVCPGDDERSWRHPYTPDDSTGGRK